MCARRKRKHGEDLRVGLIPAASAQQVRVEALNLTATDQVDKVDQRKQRYRTTSKFTAMLAALANRFEECLQPHKVLSEAHSLAGL
jgi:hypothetical protein